MWEQVMEWMSGGRWCAAGLMSGNGQGEGAEEWPMASFFSGPSVPKAPKEKKEQLPPMPEVPKAPPAPEPIPPAPTTSKLEVQQAEEDQRRQAASRKGMRKTLIAGETGGYLSPESEGKKSLLG